MSMATKVACVEIGGIPIALSTSDQRFFDLLLLRYEGFLSTSLPEFALEFDIIEAGAASDEDVCVRRDGSAWLLQRGDFTARWDTHSAKGRVRQNANPYSLDSVLRILHSLILAERGGFLLHAASAICEERAYLFSGVSGAGKTTLSRLAPADVAVLSDEISYVRKEADGYFAYGTPFAGELARAGENLRAPLATVFLLDQGAENRIEEVPSAEAVRRLMRNILFFGADSRLVDKLLSSAFDFVARVPIRRLTFYPDCKVWDEIRHFAGAPAHV